MSQSSVFYFKGSEKLPEIGFNELQRGLHYGDGFWDSFLIAAGHIHNQAAHQKRYDKSSLFLNLQTLPYVEIEKLIAEQSKVGFYRGRVTVVRFPGGRYKPEQNEVFTILEIVEATPFEISSKPVLEVMEFSYSLRSPGSEYKLLGTAGKTWLALQNTAPESKTLAFSGMDGLVCAESGNLGLMTERKHFVFPSVESGAIAGCTLSSFVSFLEQKGFSYEFRTVNNYKALSRDIAFSLNSQGITLYEELRHRPLKFEASPNELAFARQLMLEFKSFIDLI